MPKLMKNIKSEKYYDDIFKKLTNEYNNLNSEITLIIKKLKDKFIEKKDLDSVFFINHDMLDFLEISFFNGDIFKITIDKEEGIQYHINNNNEEGLETINLSFTIFNQQYDVYKKYFTLFSDNIDFIIKEINNIFDIKNNKKIVAKKIKYNNHYIYRAKNKNNFKKIISVFPLNYISNLDSFLLEHYKETIDNNNNDYFSINFVKYSLNPTNIQFKEVSVYIKNLNKSNEDIRISPIMQITREELLYELSLSFSFNNKIVKNIYELADLFNTLRVNSNKSIILSHANAIQSLKKELLRLNLEKFN